MMNRRSPSPAQRWCGVLAAGFLSFVGVVPALAVIHLDSGDPAADSTSPGDNSGWQYQGQWGSYLGTPIAPFYFVSAKHIGQAGGGTFVFHGETFNVVEGYPDPASDLCLWKVDHAFSTYAPLFQNRGAEVGQELHVFGRGTQRGDEVYLDGALRGWAWGAGDGVERWGRNVVHEVVPDGDTGYLRATFDSPGLPGEAHLSAGDSGGGLFILQDGLWRLAGINYGVDDLATAADGSGGFTAALFDARGYYAHNDDNTYTLITGDVPQPTAFYDTQISSRLDWIKSVVDPDGTLPTLPTEDFGQWLCAYFTPDQRLDDATAGPNADPDGDGVPNLLEFAFNLDPTVPEPITMTADTGLRGLPLVRLENLADLGPRLTVEFVRRTAASGAGIVYAAQFASGMDGWQGGGTESVTPINERWERVKVTDPVAAGTTRFARVLVTSSGSAPSKAPATKKESSAP